MAVVLVTARSVSDLAADVERAIARVATNGTIVCQCCNASDVTDDDHRADCPVWDLRRALVARLEAAEAQVAALTQERDAQHQAALTLARVLNLRTEQREAAEAALADTRRALDMVNRIATRGVGPDTTAEEALATIAAYIARRALAATGGDTQTCVENEDCENDWHYWRCPKHDDYEGGGTGQEQQP